MLQRAAQLLVLLLSLAGCSRREEQWPPAPRSEQEKIIIEAALRAVSQIDGWSDAACVVERDAGEWRVQVWRIVHPEAMGRDRCVPWAVRGLTLDDQARVTAYRNHL
jgi:hypothetical protein